MERSTHKRQVVVVDPYAGAVAAIRWMLEDDWQVVGMTSAADALHLIRSGVQFDAIVAAVQMYPLGGPELCAAARNRTPTPAMVLTSTGATPEDEELVRCTGIPMLTKPFKAADLRSLLDDQSTVSASTQRDRRS